MADVIWEKNMTLKRKAGKKEKFETEDKKEKR
jgi:hypothetical protein